MSAGPMIPNGEENKETLNNNIPRNPIVYATGQTGQTVKALRAPHWSRSRVLIGQAGPCAANHQLW